MSPYSCHVLPKLTHLSMGDAELRPYRARVVGAAKGWMLEIGIGTGPNLPTYGDAVDEVIGADSSPGMLTLARWTVAVSPTGLPCWSGGRRSERLGRSTPLLRSD